MEADNSFQLSTCIYMTTHFSGFELLKSGGVKLDSWDQTFPISWLRNPTQWLTIYRKAVVIPNSDVFSLNRYRCDGTRGSCYWKLIGNGIVMLRRYSVTIERLKEVMATWILITNLKTKSKSMGNVYMTSHFLEFLQVLQ
jgi:hypothetical protein